MDGIKFAACRTYSAAKAFVWIYKRSTATETAGCLFPELILRKGLAVISEGGSFCLVLIRELA